MFVSYSESKLISSHYFIKVKNWLTSLWESYILLQIIYAQSRDINISAIINFDKFCESKTILNRNFNYISMF